MNGNRLAVLVVVTLAFGLAVRAQPMRITAGAEWRAVDLSNAWPLKGSALDLSRFVEPAPAGAYGRVIRTPEGHVAFERRPGQRVLFFGCSMSPELAFGKRTLRTKAEIEALESVKDAPPEPAELAAPNANVRFDRNRVLAVEGALAGGGVCGSNQDWQRPRADPMNLK